MHPILDAFETAVAAHPERVAVADPVLTLDYRSFRAVACGLSRGLAAATSAERIGILAPTSSACAAAVFAAWYAGRTPIPLNFLLPPEELAKVVRDADIDLVCCVERFAPAVSAVGLRPLVLDAATLVAADVPAPDAADSDTAAILYTSGTSGDPKGVCLSFGNLVSNALAAIEHARMTPDQAFLSVLPQFHSFGLSTATVLPLILGATVHFVPRFSPASILGIVESQRISIFCAVASMFGALAQLKSASPQAVASVRLAISGGEPLPQNIAAAFEARFGLRLMEGYGLTETSPVVSVNMPWAWRAGSVGKPLPGVRVRVVDAAGRAVAVGQDGELVVAGPCVMQGYFRRPAETAAAILDGWFHTGDIGRIDADGFIFITGRAKDMMIIGGENVYPREIEGVLERHPAVAEVSVIGVRDDVRGELPVGFVIVKEGASATEAELRDYCRDKLAGFKVPRQVIFATDLPRGPTGKILKRALKLPG